MAAKARPDVFAVIYDGLAGAAEAHVRTVAARYTDGPPPSIHAHSVADMLTGVRDSADQDREAVF